MKPVIQRRGGAVVGRRANFYHRIYHDRLQAKLEQVSLVAAGVYANFRNYAGAGHFDGSIWFKTVERMKVRDCEVWIARRLGGEQWQEQMEAAKIVLRELREATLLSWGRDSIVIVTDFVSEQYQAPTAGAQRTRDWRARQGQETTVETKTADDAGALGSVAETGGMDPAGAEPGDGVPPLSAPARTPPPTSPASTSTSTSTSPDGLPTGFGYGFGRDNEGVTRDAHLLSKSKIEIEKRDYRPSNSTGLRPESAGEVGGGDIYAMHPVDAAVYLTHERNQWAINGFTKALQRVGRDEFTAALGEFRQALADGIRPRTSAGAFFHGIIRNREQRNNP